LRHLNRKNEALTVLKVAAHRADPLDTRSLAEQWLITGDVKTAQRLGQTLNAHPATALECAAEYMNAGLWGDGRAVLMQMVRTAPDRQRIRTDGLLLLGLLYGSIGTSRRCPGV